MSVLLSAQCTDLNVNNVTKNIYPKYNRPEHFVKLGRKRIEKLIKSIGLFRVKAKSIYLMSKQLIEKHGGRVPKALKHSKNCPVLAIKQQVWLCLKVLEFQLLQLILIYTD